MGVWASKADVSQDRNSLFLPPHMKVDSASHCVLLTRNATQEGSQPVTLPRPVDKGRG